MNQLKILTFVIFFGLGYLPIFFFILITWHVFLFKNLFLFSENIDASILKKLSLNWFLKKKKLIYKLIQILHVYSLIIWYMIIESANE